LLSAFSCAGIKMQTMLPGLEYERGTVASAGKARAS
jgi:hypothetical protein